MTPKDAEEILRRLLSDEGWLPEQDEALDCLLTEISDWETAWMVLAAHPEMPKPIQAMMRRRLERKGR